MPTSQNNRLLALEKTLNLSKSDASKRSSHPLKRHQRQRKTNSAQQHKTQIKTQIKAQAFDYDEPIELTYRNDTDSYVPGMAYDIHEEAHKDTYEEVSYEASTAEWEDNEDIDETVYEASAFEIEDNEDAEAFEVEAFEIEEDEDENNSISAETFSAIALDDKDLAEDLDFSDLDAALDEESTDTGTSEALSETDFAKDLQAILTGEKTYDKDRGGMVSADDELAIAKSQSASAAPSLTPESKPNPHDVFSQMSEHMPHNQMQKTTIHSTNSTDSHDAESHSVFDAMDMSHANSFDLGSISLEQMFDESDEEMDKEINSAAAVKTQSRVQSLQVHNDNQNTQTDEPSELDETSLVKDLYWIHEAMTESESEISEPDHELDFAPNQENMLSNKTELKGNNQDKSHEEELVKNE